MVSLIACLARNGAIGNGNKLLYHLAADMRRFVALTTSHTIVMGHNTYLSLPHGALPQRRNIVITHANRSIEGCEVCHSLEEAIQGFGKPEGSTLPTSADQGEIFIIGGESIYRQAMAYADKLYLTIVDDIPEEADTFFPPINGEEWEEISSEYRQEGRFHFKFVDYQHKQKHI